MPVSPSATSSTESPPPESGAVSASGYPGGIVPAGGSAEGTGNYIRSTIADDDPAMLFDPATVSDQAKAAYSEEELEDALRFIVRFVAEQHVDTPLINSTTDDAVAWFERHKKLFGSQNHDDFLAELTSEGSEGVIPEWPFIEGDAVVEVVYSEAEPRVIERSIKLDRISLATKDDALIFYFALDSRIAATEVGGTERSLRLHVTGQSHFVVVPNPAGGWHIVDYKNELHAVTETKKPN